MVRLTGSQKMTSASMSICRRGSGVADEDEVVTGSRASADDHRSGSGCTWSLLVLSPTRIGVGVVRSRGSDMSSNEEMSLRCECFNGD